MAMVAPVPLSVVGLRVLLERELSFGGWIDSNTCQNFQAAAVFVMALMLNGVLLDYKESERLPGEMAACLEAIIEVNQQACGVARAADAVGSSGTSVDPRPMQAVVVRLLETVFLLLDGRLHSSLALEELSHASRELAALHHKAGTGGANLYMSRLWGELQNLRRSLVRLSVIVRTTYIKLGYVFMDTLCVTCILLALLASYPSRSAGYMSMVCVSLMYSYIAALIRYADNPFDYPAGYVFPPAPPPNYSASADGNANNVIPHWGDESHGGYLSISAAAAPSSSSVGATKGVTGLGRPLSSRSSLLSGHTPTKLDRKSSMRRSAAVHSSSDSQYGTATVDTSAAAASSAAASGNAKRRPGLSGAEIDLFPLHELYPRALREAGLAAPLHPLVAASWEGREMPTTASSNNWRRRRLSSGDDGGREIRLLYSAAPVYPAVYNAHNSHYDSGADSSSSEATARNSAQLFGAGALAAGMATMQPQ